MPKRRTDRTAAPQTEAEQRIKKALVTHDLSLDLSDLGLKRLPESVRMLTWIQRLYLSSNNVKALPDCIGDLTELRILEVWDNPLSQLPPSLERLIFIERLIIDGGSASAAHKVIGSLVNLRALALARVGLTQFPPWIQNLRKLESLWLFANRLSELPEWLGQLSELTHLDVSDNELQSLPLSLSKIRSLDTLRIQGNPALQIPTELLVSSSARKILGYYLRTASPGAGQPLNEFKLILVGRGGVGKTSLVHRLVTNKYKEFKRTPGIKITQWPSKIDDDDVRAHIWDFGGQEIMHGTHRFFMTERALYLVLISGREGTEDRDAEYWLSLIRSFAGNVPVIVLLHKCDDYSFELNRALLRDKYGKGLIFLETDSFTGQGIPELRDRICKSAKKLPGLKAAWPTQWRQVKEELPNKKKSWLTFDDFRRFCDQNGVSNPRDQEALAESLHDLGLMLSYRKEETLRDFGVLNPQWVTRGIYDILNSRKLKDSGGRFTLKALAQVLPAGKYPKQLHPYLLALMRKFKLCHPLDDKGEKYLIPELLTKEEPTLDGEFPPDKCLGFIYRYDTVLPEGLVPRFIVETYVHREPKHAWRTGVVLEHVKSRALVRGDVLGRTVTIRVAGTGDGRRELLGIIREHFERIHQTYEKLPVTELVPIPGHPEAHVKHDLLLKYEQSGKKMIPVEVGLGLKDFPVKALLDGVDLPGMDAVREEEGLGGYRKSIILHERYETGELPSLFISYSHKDERLRDELSGALTAYERKGELVRWDDTEILPGQKWESEILSNLERASIIVLLLSNDFIRSDYCTQKEMKRALERDAAGECVIVPVVVRACRFDKLELGKIQAIQPKGKPIKEHKVRDAAWLDVTKQLDRVIAKGKRT